MPPTAVRVPIVADRHTALAFVMTMRGIDLTGYTLRAQVRAYPEAPLDPLVDLTNVTTAGAQGLRIRAVTGSGNTAVSEVEFVVLKAAMEALPPPPAIGKDVELAWDMTMQPPSGLEQRRFFGPFTVLAGVKR